MTAKPEFRGCAAAMMAAALLLAPPAWGGKPSPTRAPAPPARVAKSSPGRAPAPPTLREVARDFESRRLIAGAERVTFLRGTQEAVRALLAGELPADQKFAARFLAGTLSFELGDYRAASESFDRAVELAGKGGYAADAEFARIYPRAARDVARLRPSGDAFFAGEWGFRHYLREAGLRQLPVDEGEVKGGSLVVTPALALPYEIPRGLKSMLVPFEMLGYEPATPLRLQDARSHAAFYSTGWAGRLPFSFSTKVLETIEVRQVNLLIEQLPWAAVEAAAGHGPWPGYLALRGQSPLGLLARPDTRVVYRWAPQARVILEMTCGVSPDAYAPGEDTEFEFEVRQCNAAGAVLAGSSLSLRPGTRERDRDWQPVVLELHSAREGAETLELRYVSGGGRGIGVFASSVLRKPK